MVDRIVNFMEQYHMTEPGDTVILALSGGADSVCLLHVLSQSQERLGIGLEAVHVHHGLRGGEADRDESFCEELCRRLSVPYRAVHCDVSGYAKACGLSSEEAGRVLRYRAFEDAAGEREAVRIAVAHHLDDETETILHNLFRGSGLKGLRGMQPVRGRIVRPLLCVGRQEILKWLEDFELPFCEDSTNAGCDYTRNRLRNQIIPMISSEVNAQAKANILHAGMLIGQADAYIEDKASVILREHGVREESRLGLEVRILKEEAPIIQTYLIRQMIEAQASEKKDITAAHIEKSRELLDKQVGKEISLPYGLKAVRGYRFLWIEQRTEEKSGDMPVFPVEMTRFFYRKCEEIPKNKYTKWFDYDKIKGMLSVRTRETGDYLELPGGGKKTVKSYMIDEKIPACERGGIPLVAEGNHVLWVIGYRISEYYKVTDQTKTILQVSYDGGKDDGRQDPCVTVRGGSKYENQ